jgi:hypothetical protein
MGLACGASQEATQNRFTIHKASAICLMPTGQGLKHSTYPATHGELLYGAVHILWCSTHKNLMIDQDSAFERNKVAIWSLERALANEHV